MKNSWAVGEQVFYVPRMDAAANLGNQIQIGSVGAFDLPESIKKALEEGTGVKIRASVDRVLSDKLRLVLTETYDTVLAEYDEVEPLDVVTQIGDTINSRTLVDQLADAKELEANGPERFSSRNTPMVRTKVRVPVFCSVCKTRQDKGSIVYKPEKSSPSCGWISTARVCLACVNAGYAPA